MALCGPDGGVTGIQGEEVMSRPLQEGGHEAWDLITRLRSRAWIKAGLDPDSLLTRAEVAKLAETKLQNILTSYEIEQPGNHWSELQLQPFDNLVGAETFSSPGVLPNLNWQEWDAIIGGME